LGRDVFDDHERLDSGAWFLNPIVASTARVEASRNAKAAIEIAFCINFPRTRPFTHANDGAA
jgi:hypothetical protein